MLSRNQQKLIRSLHQKKQREKHGLFLIEGNTIITDLVRSGQIHPGNLEILAATPEWLDRGIVQDPGLSRLAVPADPAVLKKLSGLVSPPEVIAVLRMPSVVHSASSPDPSPMSSPIKFPVNSPETAKPPELLSKPSKPLSKDALELFRPEQLREGVTLVFESIRDPGNLGTIIRTANWFGIRNLICSPDSVDTYNNKVVQASMGAVLGTRPIYMELTQLFDEAGRFNIPVYGTTMDGADFYDTPVRVPGLIVFGNESHGISKPLESYFRQKIRIPDFPAGTAGAESLNVATSVAVVCAEIRRRQR